MNTEFVLSMLNLSLILNFQILLTCRNGWYSKLNTAGILRLLTEIVFMLVIVRYF